MYTYNIREIAKESAFLLRSTNNKKFKNQTSKYHDLHNTYVQILMIIDIPRSRSLENIVDEFEISGLEFVLIS